jgi:hypothetical protein
MTKAMLRGLGIGLISLLTLVRPALAADDVVMKALHDELDRSMKELQLEKLEKPYFISYHVQERTELNTSATFGALLSGGTTRARYLTVQVRVGDYQRDNSNFLAYPLHANGLTNSVMLPLDDDYQELRRQIWLATDEAYKAAVETLSRKRAALENRNTRENLPDFSQEQPTTALEPAVPVRIDLEQAEALVRNLSALFREQPEIFTSSASLEFNDTRSWYLNSEGSATTQESSAATFVTVAQTQAADGMTLPDWVISSARTMAELPKESELAQQIRAMADRLTRLRQAPLVDRYTGPIIFDVQAGAEIVSQVLAAKLLSVRTPASDNPRIESYAAQSVSKLQDRMGARVLPNFLTVVDDPTLSTYEGKPLLGGHTVDDEGVRARPVTLVDKGILKTLLATRDPVSGIPHSTGSYRTFGAEPSNLIITVENGVTGPELKTQLLDMVKQRTKEFGIEVRSAAREAVKVYPDGHDELIRLGQFEGLDEGAFKDVAAASRELTVYTIPFAAYGGRIYPGQSRSPLVSFVAPSFLFEDLTIKPASGEPPKLPLSKPPSFEK